MGMIAVELLNVWSFVLNTQKKMYLQNTKKVNKYHGKIDKPRISCVPNLEKSLIEVKQSLSRQLT